MNAPISLKIIVGSTRENRFADQAATWIAEIAQKNQELQVEVLDLRDYEMPFFDGVQNPSMKSKPYPHESVERWTRKIAEGDAFIIVTPEYNHSTTGVVKNALDWVYKEWNNKAIGFVSYGAVGGARAVEHLRMMAIELQMAPVRESVHFLGNEYFAAAFGDRNFVPMFEKQQESAKVLLSQVTNWAKALKSIREV
ncbi:MAG: NAD(P)H-dependent oxidoreductase [Microgenomates group bacterium]